MSVCPMHSPCTLGGPQVCEGWVQPLFPAPACTCTHIRTAVQGPELAAYTQPHFNKHMARARDDHHTHTTTTHTHPDATSVPTHTPFNGGLLGCWLSCGCLSVWGFCCVAHAPGFPVHRTGWLELFCCDSSAGRYQSLEGSLMAKRWAAWLQAACVPCTPEPRGMPTQRGAASRARLPHLCARLFVLGPLEMRRFGEFFPRVCLAHLCPAHLERVWLLTSARQRRRQCACWQRLWAFVGFGWRDAAHTMHVF